MKALNPSKTPKTEDGGRDWGIKMDTRLESSKMLTLMLLAAAGRQDGDTRIEERRRRRSGCVALQSYLWSAPQPTNLLLEYSSDS